jgi:hypothetical protein
MYAYRKRDASRNYFPQSVKRKILQTEAVRHIGPHWIVAGRRPRTIAVFFLRRTTLSARAAP